MTNMTTSHPSKTLIQPDEPVKGEAKYRALFELSPVAIFLLDNDGNFLSINSAGARLLKASEQEMVGANIASTYRPGELSSAPLEQRNGSHRFERSFLRRDGTSIPVEISLSAVQSGTRQAVVQDISERKHAAARLERALDEAKRSEDHLQLVLNSIPMMVWSDNQDGKNDFCNQQVLDYLGVPTEEAANYDWKNTLHPEDAARVAQKWELARATGEMYEVRSVCAVRTVPIAGFRPVPYRSAINRGRLFAGTVPTPTLRT